MRHHWHSYYSVRKPRTLKKRARRVMNEYTRDRKRERGAHDRWSWEASMHRCCVNGLST